MDRAEHHPANRRDEADQDEQQERQDEDEGPQLAAALDRYNLIRSGTPSGLPAIWTAIVVIDFSLRSLVRGGEEKSSSPFVGSYFASQVVKRWFNSSPFSFQKSGSSITALATWSGAPGRSGSSDGSTSAIPSLLAGLKGM